MKKILLSTFLLSSLLIACTSDNTAVENESTSSKKSNVEVATSTSEIEKAKTLLLAKWQGPYQGIPEFDKVSLIGLIPAIEEGMRINLAEIDVIANNVKAPTFENTIVAMEKTGNDLGRVFTYGIWGSNQSSTEFRKIQAEMAPKLSAFFSKINQNEKLFTRIQTVFNNDEVKMLTPEQQRLVLLTYNDFARNGATLNTIDKKRYADINQRLAELHTKFGNNVLADEESYVLYLSKDQLGGLPESIVSVAASAATIRDREGEYAITNTRSSMDPFLTYSTERKLRKQVWNTYY